MKKEEEEQELGAWVGWGMGEAQLMCWQQLNGKKSWCQDLACLLGCGCGACSGQLLWSSLPSKRRPRRVGLAV
jgi:hypothetical protein